MAPRRVKIKWSVCNVPRTVPGPQWRLHAKHPLSSLLLLCIDVAEEGMATHSSILAWRIPWTEKPGGLQSIVLQRVRHDWVTDTFTLTRVYTQTQTSISAYKYWKPWFHLDTFSFVSIPWIFSSLFLFLNLYLLSLTFRTWLSNLFPPAPLWVTTSWPQGLSHWPQSHWKCWLSTI